MHYNRRILICAYACEPNKGSEPGVGWDTVINLAKEDSKTEYSILTRENNRGVIEAQETPTNLKFIYYDLNNIILFLKRAGNFSQV